MATLKPCRGCKHEIHPSAKTCPNCGIANPGQSAAKGCLGVVLIVAVFTIILAANAPDTPTTPEKPKTPAELRQEQVQKLFNPWNGEHISLARLVKQNMKNPDSYQHVETSYIDKGDRLIVTTTFRGTNGFGGVVPSTVKAEVDLNGNVIRLLK